MTESIERHQIKNVYEALLDVRRDVGAIGKESRNSHFGFNFRGIEEVLNAVGPALLAHGVHCFPRLLNLDSRDVTTKKGEKNREVTVTVEYHYVGPGGDEFVVVVPGEAADAGSSGVSKAMSVALRIAHLQALQIPTAMTDPEAGSIERGEDPTLQIKKQIVAEAKTRGWISDDGDDTQMFTEFFDWSKGSQLSEADLPVLKDFLTHLRPNVKMQRKSAGGDQ